MVRILVHVEGETEETFVREALSSHLLSFGKSASARLVGNARLRSRRGGIRSWASVSRDIVRHLKSDPDSFSTTMVDYYALPQSGEGKWPGRYEAGLLPFEKKAPTVQAALLHDICNQMGVGFNTKRFIPYVMMHEFEGLLFSDCKRFAQGIGMPLLETKFEEVRNQFSTPEEINDSPLSAPSKRVEAIVPGYEKPFHGNLAILEITLKAIRAQCPLFNDWLCALEAV